MAVLLRGKKVGLRDLTEEDIRTIYYYNFDAEDREHLNWNGPYHKPERVEYEQYAGKYRPNLALADSDMARHHLAIEINGELKGTVGRYWVAEETNWFEIGIVIYDSRYWSGGYGSEAFRMWMDYLFQTMDTVRLGIGTWSGNVRMMGLAAKCGMVEEARVRKARIVRGEYYDAIKMGILREEWEALGNRS